MNKLEQLVQTAREYERELPPQPAQGILPVGIEVAKWIDHTLLKMDASQAQLKQLCEEARKHRFASVCVNPVNVAYCAGLLDGGVPVCSVVGFPLGASSAMVKGLETLGAVSDGAREIDMVINVGALRSEAWDVVFRDIVAVVETAHAHEAHVKVIIEAGLLSGLEKIIACLFSQAAGADFVKTSTGMMAGGATVEDVNLMRRIVGPGMGVKAAGGIRTYADVLKMAGAGANRIGASAGVKIIEEALLAI